MTVKSIAHAAYRCRDMEKSLRFYCDVLGLRKVFDIKNDEGQPHINYLKVADGQFIELFYTKPDETPQNASYAHLCLEVFDIYKACGEIKNAGWPVDVEPQRGKDKNIQAWVTDPDGNKIELMQISPESPQANS